MTDAQTYHAIGYRDALAVVCANARLSGVEAAVRDAAKHLLEMDPEHCHAKVVLEEMKQEEEERAICSSCKSKLGVPRSDNGVAAGIHCDTCWQDLMSGARQRSW